MAKGDVVNGLSNLANNASLQIKPSAGVDWAIHNLYYGAGCEVRFTDGTNSILIESPAAGQSTNRSHRATNTRWFEIKNTSGSSANFGYDGVQTR